LIYPPLEEAGVFPTEINGCEKRVIKARFSQPFFASKIGQAAAVFAAQGDMSVRKRIKESDP
jgi:hypothetical protein